MRISNDLDMSCFRFLEEQAEKKRQEEIRAANQRLDAVKQKEVDINQYINQSAKEIQVQYT